MRRALVIIGALLAAVLFLPAPDALADTEPVDLATSCHVDVPGAVDGERVVVDASVTANSTTQPTGTVDLSIRKGSKSIWSDSVAYPGTPIRVTGPRLRPGRYVANIVFRPASGAYQGCTGSLAFHVSPGAAGLPGTAGGPGQGGAADGTPGAGLLPNTGGPHLALLLLGLGLVVAGGGVVTGSRRLA